MKDLPSKVSADGRQRSSSAPAVGANRRRVHPKDCKWGRPVGGGGGRRKSCHGPALNKKIAGRLGRAWRSGGALAARGEGPAAWPARQTLPSPAAPTGLQGRPILGASESGRKSLGQAPSGGKPAGSSAPASIEQEILGRILEKSCAFGWADRAPAKRLAPSKEIMKHEASCVRPRALKTRVSFGGTGAAPAPGHSCETALQMNPGSKNPARQPPPQWPGIQLCRFRQHHAWFRGICLSPVREFSIHILPIKRSCHVDLAPGEGSICLEIVRGLPL